MKLNFTPAMKKKHPLRRKSTSNYLVPKVIRRLSEYQKSKSSSIKAGNISSQNFFHEIYNRVKIVDDFYS